MKIETNRTVGSDGSLTFTIRVSHPHGVEFSDSDQELMRILDRCKNNAELVESDGRIKEDIIRLIHAAKEKTFDRIMFKLNFDIKNNFEPRFKHICQEIYNWIYNAQTGELKQWMQDFDPQRTKFYFDNDRTNEDDDGEDGE
jgi:hypothetical protein